MKRRRRHWMQALAVSLPLLCSALVAAGEPAPGPGVERADLKNPLPGLTPSQEYAGEILAYLLRLVLGKAGDPSSREAWRTTGLDEPLDFEGIRERMTDPEKSELGLLVLDPKILGLMRVLYHYDPDLNLHKRSFGILSIYPAPEFVAIRLLLLQKIHRSEKIHLKELIDRRCLLAGNETMPSPEDLKAVNLSAEEMMFLRSIIQAEPHFYAYLQSPFLCSALYEMGAVELDEFVSLKIREAGYGAYRCHCAENSSKGNGVRILVLPSFMGEFDPKSETNSGKDVRLMPTELFEEVVERLKTDIRAAATALFREKFAEGKGGPVPVGASGSAALPESMVERLVSFHVLSERPLVVYPDNASRVIQEVCPEADFTVILLDKNVYLSIHIREKGDVYPSVPRMYTDILDVKYAQYQDQLDLIGRFIVAKLEHRPGNAALPN